MRSHILTGALTCAFAPLAFGSTAIDPANRAEAMEYRIFFGDKKTAPDRESSAFLKDLNKILASSPGSLKQVTVEAHATRTGKESGNLLVSRKRATSVAEAFQSAGIAKDTIRTVAYGSSKLVPELPPSHPEQRRANIRVELRNLDVAMRKALEDLAEKNLQFISVDETGLKQKE